MCGLAGFLKPAGFAEAAATALVADMAGTLTHRGPDDRGTWLDGDAGIALGHQRLAVLDLTPTGRQPMQSHSGRYVIAFNGEIYNHSELREELTSGEGSPHWRGHSDTETLLTAIDRWGVADSLSKCVGMFAIALWDRQLRVLTLARDRMGEKPLYYGWQREQLLFGSELKALRAHPGFQGDIDRDVLALYFRRGFVPAPHSIYANVSKLMPGCFVQFDTRSRPGHQPPSQAYWSLRETVNDGLTQPYSGGDDAAVAELDTLLRRVVAAQSVADVPLGAFLSGGIDSSTVVALMQAQSSRPVQTFTIGFTEAEYNEAKYAKRVADHLGTEHTEWYLSPREAIDVIPRLATLYDEPLGDSSAIPTFLVSQLARRHVTVSLSGDGGDELFGGYTRYRRTYDISTKLRRLPTAVRRGLAATLGPLARRSGASSTNSRVKRLAQYLRAAHCGDLYEIQMSPRLDEKDLVLRCGGSPPDWDYALGRGTLYDEMMFADGSSYLPDDILVKVDRASMGVSLESRVPLLDHRVVEFAWRMPLHLKIRNNEGKWLLKKVLQKYLPLSLVERPKMGFGVPVGAWIRGPLRDWAENLLSANRLTQQGFLDAKLVRNHWSHYVNNDASSDDSIWQLLMFQEWLQNEATYDADGQR